MSFLFPYVLWGLLAISVPVIIHLFNFRKFRKVYFTNVRFLEELKQKTRKQSKLRHLLVMIFRMLAISALVLAFAQPYIPRKNTLARPDALKQVGVYIDNSFSMEALSTAGPLLEIAKAKALEIAAAYRSTDLFMLTTNEFEGRYKRWVSREEFVQLLGEINPTPTVRTFSEVVNRQNDSYFDYSGQNKISYIISDFQLNMLDLENYSGDSLFSVRFVPLEAVEYNNLYIDSCWFVSPVHQLYQGVKLVVRVVNDSETSYEKMPLKLTINGIQKALASFDISPGAFVDIELPFTNNETGIQNGMVEITDYPVVFDDIFYLVYDVAGTIPVLAINGGGESPYLNSLYGNDSAFRFENNPLKNIDYDRLRENKLIILNEIDVISSGLSQELNVYLENGGTILVIPSAKSDLTSYREFLANIGANYYVGFVNDETRVSEIDLENPLFTDVFEKSSLDRQGLENTDLPWLKSYFTVTTQSRSLQTTVMSMINGKPFLSMESAGNGKIYLLASPLGDEYTNFARHAIFVPALYRIALLSAATVPLYYVIGRDEQIEIGDLYLPGNEIVKIASNNEDFEFIPGQRYLNRKLNLQFHNQINTAGHYSLLKNGEPVKGLGFNYNRKESAMQFADPDLLDEMIARYNITNAQVITAKEKPLTETIKDMNQGILLWKLFVILALIFLAIEVILLRFLNSGT